MFQIRPSKKTFIALISIAVVAFGVFAFVYWNRAASLGSLRNQVSKKEQEVAKSQEIKARLGKVEQEYLTARAELSILEQGVSTKAYVPTLLRQIEELGKTQRLKVVGVRPNQTSSQTPAPVAPAADSASGDKAKEQPVKKPEPYDKLNIDLEVHGKYADVMSFVQRVTSFPKIVQVNSMQVSPLTTSDMPEMQSPRLSIKLNTTAYVLKDRIAQSENAGRAPDDKPTAAPSGGKI